jgi:hypothetical protein
VLHSLVFPAVALVVLDGAEDLGTEKSISLRLEGAIVDGLGLLDLAVRPLPDFLGRCQGNLHGVVTGRILGLCKKIIQLFHALLLLILRGSGSHPKTDLYLLPFAY